MRSGTIFAMLLLGLVPLVSTLPLPLVTAQAQETEVPAEAEMPPLPRPRPNRDAPDPTALPADGTQTPATEAITALTSVPQPVVLTAHITQDGAPITEGLVWRVFNTTPDAAGELAVVAKSEAPEPTIELPPGEYVVHVAYGRAQASDTLTVAPGANSKSFILEAGALRLNSAVTGDIPIPAGQLKFDILTAGSEANRTVVAQGLLPNDIVTLNAGTYHIVSYFGDINAVVRADLRVEPGQLTDATLYHHASQVSFKLVSEEGGEAIADVEWTVKTPDGTTIFTDLGAFPSTVLAEGDYRVLAQQGESVFNRDFEVRSGSPEEIEVLTAVY